MHGVLFPPPDRPLLWSPVYPGVSWVEPVPIHRPHAGGHGSLHYRR